MEQSFTLSPPTSAEALSRVRAHVALLRASEAPHQRSHAEDLEALVKLAESDQTADLKQQIVNLHANLDDLMRQRDEAREKVAELENRAAELVNQRDEASAGKTESEAKISETSQAQAQQPGPSVS